ncbi:hypothetical protein D3C81_991410 [compost metagenome]
MRIAWGVCHWLSRRKWPMSWCTLPSRWYRYLRRHSRAPITSSNGRNSSGRWLRPSASSLTPEPQGKLATWSAKRSGTKRSQSQSSGLLLGIQNICSSRVVRNPWAVPSSCFWLSCRVIDSLSRADSSRLRRSSRSLRVMATSSRALRSCGVTSSGGWLASNLST